MFPTWPESAIDLIIDFIKIGRGKFNKLLFLVFKIFKFYRFYLATFISKSNFYKIIFNIASCSLPIIAF